MDEAVAYYLTEGSLSVALGFVDALERAYGRSSQYPTAGLPHYASELNLTGLRHWPLNGYPHLVFYVERDDHIDVWRILHGGRDIPAWMQQPEG